MDLRAFEVLDDRRLGEGGYLALRRLRLRLVRADGTSTAEGTYDFVERPAGLDAVVLVLWMREVPGVRVLLRDALRVPLHFGRPEGATAPAAFTEVVAGIVEAGEDGEDALRRRASAEALEEAGLTIAADRIERLGPPMFPTPGMCAELFHFLCAEVSPEEKSTAARPGGDGSPFEEGAHVRWVPLDDALAACARGEVRDLKTELALRRLAERVR